MVTNRVFPVFPVPISIYNLGEEFHEMNEQLVEDSFIEKNRHSHGELMSNKGCLLYTSPSPRDQA